MIKSAALSLAALALLFVAPACAQTIAPPTGCVAGVDCAAKSIALGGAAIGTNALAVTGTASISGDVSASQGLFASHVQAGSSQSFYWNARSGLTSSVDGNIRLGNNAGTSFGLLQFGGTTSSFPAFKRSGTVLQARLADDSGDASLTAANGSFSGNVTLSSGSVLVSTNAGQIVLGASNDLHLSRSAAGVLQHGDVDAAAPVAQTVTAQSVVAGTSNTAAPNFTFDMPKGTGTGVGGSFIVRVAPAGSTGSTQNAEVNALVIDGGTKTTTLGGALFPNGNLVMPQSNSIQFNGITTISAANDGVLRWAKNNGSQNTVASLVACSSILDGMRGFVTDATAATFASAVAGGGANHVPVYCDGSGTPTWKIG